MSGKELSSRIRIRKVMHLGSEHQSGSEDGSKSSIPNQELHANPLSSMG